MRSRLLAVVTLTGLLVTMMIVPASPHEQDCNGGLGARYELSQRVALNNEGTLANTRGIAVTLNVWTPWLHKNFIMGPPNGSSVPSWIRQAVRIQTSNSSYLPGSTYIEYGWEYWWQHGPFYTEEYQRRGYYVYNNNGADPNPHYLGNIGAGDHRFYLFNTPTGSNPNKWVLQTKNMTSGQVVTHKVFDPPYDQGNAFSLVASSDTCNEMGVQTKDSWRYSGTNNKWLKVGTQYYAGYWYGQGGDISNPTTHWHIGSWTGGYEEWRATCYKVGYCTKTPGAPY